MSDLSGTELKEKKDLLESEEKYLQMLLDANTVQIQIIQAQYQEKLTVVTYVQNKLAEVRKQLAFYQKVVANG